MRRFWLIILVVLALAGQGAWAATHNTTGNSDDTPSGTLITAESADSSLGYSDLGATVLPTVEVEGGDVDYTADAEYGFSALRTIVDNLSVSPGDILTHETYSVTNEGNADDTSFNIYSLYTENNGAQNWIVEVVNDDTSTIVATLTADSINTYSPTLPDNDDVDVHYLVTVPSSLTDAPDLSSIEVITTIETTSDPAGLVYRGGNDLTYGGSDEVTDDFVDQVSTPTLVITRETVIDSPTDYITNGGGANDPVPGAVATFTMYYENVGSANASNVVIVDKIPTIEAPVSSDAAGTKLGHVNAGAGARAGLVTLTHGGQGTATGWTAYYTTEATPDTSYDAAGWVSIGSVDSNDYPTGAFYTPSDAQSGAVWIKWQKTPVAAAESATLVWGTIIR
jgi:hypothetical protein